MFPPAIRYDLPCYFSQRKADIVFTINDMYFVEKYHLSLLNEKERKHNILEIT